MSNATDHLMTTVEFIEWAEAMDAAGKRDEHQHKIFETQAEFKLRQQQRTTPAGQTLSLF